MNLASKSKWKFSGGLMLLVLGCLQHSFKEFFDTEYIKLMKKIQKEKAGQENE